MVTVCMRCGAPREGLEVRCKRCGGPFKEIPDYPFVKEDFKKNFPYIKTWISLGEGNTPMISKRGVYFKLDFLNPTGSYKDRGSVTLISYLKQNGITRITEDSSGNAGASIAAYGAAAGIEVKVFVPETAKGAKLAQIQAYGAKVVKVPGSRENVSKAAEEASKEGYYYASHILQPQFRDGIRTLAYEIVRDLGWRVPDYVFLPISAGTLLLGVNEGFEHMLRSGAIDHKPKIIGVQTKEVSPVCSKFKNIEYKPPEKLVTIADALVSTNPIFLDDMVKVLSDCIIVSDDEIIDAHKELAKEGLLVEYSSATVWAAFKKFISNESKIDNVVLVLTGNGLKTLQ